MVEVVLCCLRPFFSFRLMKIGKLKLSLTTQILLALILGFVLGLLLQGNAEFAKSYIAPLGTIFLNLLKFIVVPLVLVSIIVGIISMKDVSSLGRLGIRTLAYFMATTIVAVSLGLVISTLLKGFFPVISISTAEQPELATNMTFMDQIVNMFPRNFVEPMVKNEMMQVIVIALLVGFAIVKVGEKAKPVADLLNSINEITVAILVFIMKLAPFGVFCLLCPVVAENGAQIVGTYAALIGSGEN